MTAPIATGLSYGMSATAQHAETAVARALKRAGCTRAHSVLLFLTPEYAANPTPAIRAAARAAGSTQVTGCTGNGVITDEEWVLDSPGAAAMVFTGDVGLVPSRGADYHGEAVLSLCTPQGISADWMDIPMLRLGAVSSDILGKGQFAVWNAARVSGQGCIDSRISNARHAITVSQGIRALTAPIEVAEVEGYEVLRMGSYPAFNVLVKSLPTGMGEVDKIPLHLLIGGVTYGDPSTAIHEGRYHLNHIIAADPRNRSITLAQPLNPGEKLFWAMRDSLAAERDMRRVIDHGVDQVGGDPDFALLFGPSFFGNRDRDVDQLRQRLPGMPFIGFYGNGEIGPMQGENHLYQFSSVLGLFRAQ